MNKGNKGRYQKIKYDNEGKPFVTFYGKKLNLDEFQFLQSRQEYFYCPNVFCAYILDIDVNGEYARVTFQTI